MRRILPLLVVSLLAAWTGCSKKPIATVEFTHQLQPKAPLDARYMQIAVRDAQVEGDTAEFDQKKWCRMTADMIQHHLEKAGEKHNLPIKLVDRDHVKLTMEEKDLAAAGVSDKGESLASAQITGANAILTSRVTIKIDKQVGKQRTINAMSVFASAWSRGGAGGGSVDSEEVDEERRNITVQCQFQLKDASSNDVVVSYNGAPAQHTQNTKASPFFGSSQTEADMTPRDRVIGEIVERQAQEFMGKFVPMEVRTSVEVEPSSEDESIAGVRSLVEENYEAALGHFKQAIAADADDHRSLFGAGVCCEKLNRLDEARRYYKLAESLDKGEPRYKAAVGRIAGAG
jgi:hypothetical protein